MKLSGASVEPFLRDPRGRCRGALVYGPDDGLVRERAALIAGKAGSSDPFACVRLSESDLKNDPARLSDELRALGLGGGRRLVTLEADSDRAAALIADALDGPAPEAFLLVIAGELPPRGALRRLFEERKELAALPCYRDEAEAIGRIARQALEAEGIRCDRDTLAFLSANLGNDRGVTRSELEKIALYALEEKTLGIEQLRGLLDANLNADLDGLCNALADRDPAAADGHYRRSLREGAQPVAILRAAQRYFLRLYGLAARVAAGDSPAGAVESLRPPLFFKQAPLTIRHLGRWTPAQALATLRYLAEAELRLKTSGAAEEALCGQALLGVASLGSRQRQEETA